MGFGLLFFGYFIATLMSVHTYGSYFRLIGYAMVFVSALKLKKYNRKFAFLSVSSILMIALSIALVIGDVCGYLYELMIVDANIFGDAFRLYIGYVEMAVSFILNTALLYAIQSIAKETEVEKIYSGAIRNFVFVCIYFALYVLQLLPIPALEDFGKYFSAPLLLMYFVWIILNIVLIYQCYANICDENDVEMEQKPSRFAFVNNMRAKSEERKQKYQAEREELKALREQRKKK